ncbi:2Fe-2S ferredoxin-type iron-sulfur binding domain [Dillenia turbinata]|uniref:2Fe-2S ferredoxin-type iron-sulfur binding domain n=1 Tax=Dillenia turbinata TaxID=194707 RepID=A0AAN8U955_9MAGN
MATIHVHFSFPISLQRLQKPAINQNSHFHKPISFESKNRSSLIYTPRSSSSPAQVPEKHEIELEFIGPKPEPDGSYQVQRASAVSGEKLLRNIMLDNKIELYAAYGKVMNCGGGGSCGTCIVEIIDGKDLLNERTNTELRYLKKACYFQSLNLNLGDLLVRPLLETKKILARLWFRDCPSGRSD